jgi:hypothetical protein
MRILGRFIWDRRDKRFLEAARRASVRAGLHYVTTHAINFTEPIQYPYFAMVISDFPENGEAFFEEFFL